jgi:hypothetical protein
MIGRMPTWVAAIELATTTVWTANVAYLQAMKPE